jgi:hypothetical protein
MTIKDAITAHVNRKLRIKSLLSGTLQEKLDPLTIARDTGCELGKWLHSDAEKVLPQPQRSELLAIHADFHRETARIVKEFYAGHKIGPEVVGLDSTFGKLTTQIVGSLSRIGKP